MTPEETVYRRLQEHLDRQAVGFPATRSGADLRFLKGLFAPDEARLALHLSFRPTPQEQIVSQAAPEFAAEQAAALLDGMLQKGAIGWKTKDGISLWYVVPVVIGMYEAQDGNPTPEFLDTTGAYMKTLDYGKSFLAVKPSQMRTVPINKSIPIERPVALYDDIRSLVRESPGPFVVLKCICREGKAMRGKPCTKTTRAETCLAMADMASMVLRRKHGREVTREEALAILEQNEADGLVLQPANARKPEFVCSCCGCCCGMLSVQKMIPHPVDFWTSNFFADVSASACTRCGRCVTRCQVGAVALTGPGGKAKISRSRCIGCGLCVTTCPAKAIRLQRKANETVPPADEEALYEKIMANKKGPWGQVVMLVKLALRMRQ